MQSICSLFVLLTVSLLVINGQPIDNNDILSIASGTSFGFCRGYCRQSINITANPLQVLVSREPNSDPASYPPVHVKFSFNETEWTDLVNLINLKTFESLDDRIGCPDCADGGAEWIQINWANGNKQVTFENGQTVKGIEELTTKLRQMREVYLSKV